MDLKVPAVGGSQWTTAERQREEKSLCGNDLQTLLDFCGSPQNDAVEREGVDSFRNHITCDRFNVIDFRVRSRPFILDDVEALVQATRSVYILPVLLAMDVLRMLAAGIYGKDDYGQCDVV